jgi:polyhydroxybutyrate depolymerase
MGLPIHFRWVSLTIRACDYRGERAALKGKYRAMWRWMGWSVALMLALAVSAGGTGAQDADDRATSPTLTLCVPAKAAVETGQADLTLASGGIVRSYRRYIPTGYDPNIAAPLVLSLHGFASWSAQQQELTGFDALAEAHGFVVVYPQGTGIPLRWNDGAPFRDPAATAADIAFIADLLDALAADLCIDPDRVYVNGMSNGGGMAHTLACELGDRFAALGTVAGAQSAHDQPCPISITRALPVIGFHGTADPIVPYDGGQSNGFDFPPVLDWAAVWAARNGCDHQALAVGPDDPHYPLAAGVSALRYVDCDDDVEVVFYTLDGGGHTWPGGMALPERLTGLTYADLDASAVMWDFFARYRRANQDEAQP